MGWKIVAASNTPAHDWEKDGKEVTGVLLGKRSGVGPNKSMLYELELPDGSKKAVWGSAGLDGAFLAIAEGQEVKITYKGMKENPKTKRQFKNFEVAVNEGRA